MPSFVYTGSKPIDPWAPEPGTMVLDPRKPRPVARSGCVHRRVNATVCDPRLRTVNIQAACGSPDDIFYFSPWRAPGSAPVIDSCGSAGGRFPGTGFGKPGSGASFQNSTLAKLGDRGSGLPAMPPQATWKAGSSVEVGWALMAWHGGGYTYRMAPAAGPLTEAEFGALVNLAGGARSLSCLPCVCISHLAAVRACVCVCR
jgi:hypothetical protein